MPEWKVSAADAIEMRLSKRMRPPWVTGLTNWHSETGNLIVDVTRWDEKAGLRRDAVGSQVIDALEAQEIKETGNEED
jgi:hypothetical protein